MAGEASRKNGKRGGRPKGSTTKPQILDYFSDKEIEDIAKRLKVQAKTDSTILKFVAEELFGKAPQRMELTGKDGETLVVQLSNTIASKREINGTSSGTG